MKAIERVVIKREVGLLLTKKSTEINRFSRTSEPTSAYNRSTKWTVILIYFVEVITQNAVADFNIICESS